MVTHLDDLIVRIISQKQVNFLGTIFNKSQKDFLESFLILSDVIPCDMDQGYFKLRNKGLNYLHFRSRATINNCPLGLIELLFILAVCKNVVA